MAVEADYSIAELQRRMLGGYQLLQALIGIRLRNVADPESRRHLAWLSDVTAALGLLQRRLGAESPIDFPGYLEDTAAFWTRACEGRAIRIEVRAASKRLPDLHALALAIIAHELITNAIRHGFPGDRRGSVAIAYSRSSTGVSLVVRDSGAGALQVTHGEGLGLVSGLVEHLGGVMTIETAPEAGLGVRVRLPLPGQTEH